MKSPLLIFWLFTLTLASTFADQRPNILFLFTDDHATQALSAYGGSLAKIAPTPNLDRIAKEGILFRKCYVTNSICGPSRAVIQTGKYSHLNGFRNNGDTFDGSQPASQIHSNGFRSFRSAQGTRSILQPHADHQWEKRETHWVHY